MMEQSGRRVPVSLPRRWIADLMWVSRGRPIISFERRMNLAPLAAARAHRKIRWSILFMKALALVAKHEPLLRRVWMPWPWPHLYESNISLCCLPFEREFGGEPAVFFGIFREPDNQTLAQLQEHLENWKHDPPEATREFRRMIRISKCPWPLRRLAWLYALNISGRTRGNVFGTYGVSITASGGGSAINLISPLTATLNYGIFEADHALDVRLHFDHRVFDGMTAARILKTLEDTLNGAMVRELTAGEAASEPPG